MSRPARSDPEAESLALLEEAVRVLESTATLKVTLMYAESEVRIQGKESFELFAPGYVMVCFIDYSTKFSPDIKFPVLQTYCLPVFV